MKNLFTTVLLLVTVIFHLQAQLESCNNPNELYFLADPDLDENYGIIGAGKDCNSLTASIRFVNKLQGVNIGEIQFHSGWMNGTKSMSMFGQTVTVHSNNFRIEKNSHFRDVLSINGSGAVFKKQLYIDDNSSIGIGVSPTTEKFQMKDGNMTIENGEVSLKNSSFRIADSNNENQFSVGSNGVILARKVEVTLQPIPDYVFLPNYNLMPLRQVKAYIEENGHLPNIPSESEYKERGSMDLGELNLKLLEKVEELTLYLLQQQEEIDALKAELSEIRK